MRRILVIAFILAGVVSAFFIASKNQGSSSAQMSMHFPEPIGKIVRVYLRGNDYVLATVPANCGDPALKYYRGVYLLSGHDAWITIAKPQSTSDDWMMIPTASIAYIMVEDGEQTTQPIGSY